MIGNEDDLARLLTRVLEDYRDDAEFFSEHRLPEYLVMEELSLEGRDLAQFLTFTCVTNHIHDDTGKSKKTDGQDGLWQVCARLWCEQPWMYRPEELVGDGRRAQLESILNDQAIMDSRDPDWWWQNATNLYEDYDSDPRVLLESEDYLAPEIKQTVSAERFLGLRGEKICPLWLRLMHEEVHPLEQIEQVSIPVDFHIVGITNKLAGTDFDRYNEDDLETLRNYWRILCEKHGFVAVEIDKPLWLLNKYWRSAGEQYIRELLTDIGVAN